MTERTPDYAVIRSPGKVMDGKWYDLTQLGPEVRGPLGWLRFYRATGEIVVRDDGAVGEVYEFHPDVPA